MADHLGSTNGLADASGNLAAQAGYDAFGNQTGALPTRYGYTGRERDDFTGLLHYRARSYSPELGRFISEDPIGFAGGDINIYGYVKNNPLRYKDPLGLSRCNPYLGALVGGLGGAVGGAIGGGVIGGVAGGSAGCVAGATGLGLAGTIVGPGGTAIGGLAGCAAGAAAGVGPGALGGAFLGSAVGAGIGGAAGWNYCREDAAPKCDSKPNTMPPPPPPPPDRRCKLQGGIGMPARHCRGGVPPGLSCCPYYCEGLGEQSIPNASGGRCYNDVINL